MVLPTTKRCTKCGEVKPLDAFSREARNKKDGRQGHCRECHRIYYGGADTLARVNAERADKQHLTQQGLRRCPKCKEAKPLEYFYEGQSHCKACISIQGKNYRQSNTDEVRARDRSRYIRDREQRLAAIRAWRQSNPDLTRERDRKRRQANLSEVRRRNRVYYHAHREEQRVYRQKYNVEHREKLRQGSREWYANNRDRVVVYRQKYHKIHPEVKAASERRRKARKKGAGILTLTAAQWQETLEYFNYRCAYCGRLSDEIEQDHMIPLSRGGQHTVDNVVPACGDCNRRKFTKTPLEIVGGL